MKCLFFLITLILSSGSFAQINPQSRTEELVKLKSELEVEIDKTPYYGEEHTTIKKYFSALQELNEDLKNNRRYLRKFSGYIRNMGIGAFCSSAFLEREKWTRLIKNCTKNNFFLCSEEVKLYPEIKDVLVNIFEEDIRIQLEALQDCK